MRAFGYNKRAHFCRFCLGFVCSFVESLTSVELLYILSKNKCSDFELCILKLTKFWRFLSSDILRASLHNLGCISLSTISNTFTYHTLLYYLDKREKRNISTEKSFCCWNSIWTTVGSPHLANIQSKRNASNEKNNNKEMRPHWPQETKGFKVEVTHPKTRICFVCTAPVFTLLLVWHTLQETNKTKANPAILIWQHKLCILWKLGFLLLYVKSAPCCIVIFIQHSHLIQAKIGK